MSYFHHNQKNYFGYIKFIPLWMLLVPVVLFSQNTIFVQVNNVSSDKGQVNVAVYDSEDFFLKFDGVVKAKSAPAQIGTVNLTLENLPAGDYALAIFHDKNGNDILDTNWLGIPKEKVAFSKSKMKTFGPPKYEECRFKVEGDTEISISF